MIEVKIVGRLITVDFKNNEYYWSLIGVYAPVFGSVSEQLTFF